MRVSELIAAAALVLVACGPAPSVEKPARDRIFVSQAGSSTVAVVDGSSGTIVARIEVGLLPHNLVLSADRKSLFVAVVGSQSVAEIDVDTARLRRTMLTAPVPDRRADGSLIQEHLDRDAFSHTTCHDCHRVGGAQPKYAGDRPFGLLLDADGRRLLVSHLNSANLAVLELEAGAIERSVHLARSGAAVEPVALAALDDQLWVALRPLQPSTDPGALRRLDRATLSGRGEVPTGSDPGALLSLPGRRSVLVTNFETDTVTEHSAPGTARAVEVAPGPLGMLALPDGRVLVLGYYSNALSLVDPATGTSETFPLQRAGTRYANPTHAALSSDGRTAWLVSSGTDGHLLQLDLASWTLVKEVPIDGLSFGIAVVPAPTP